MSRPVTFNVCIVCDQPLDFVNRGIGVMIRVSTFDPFPREAESGGVMSCDAPTCEAVVVAAAAEIEAKIRAATFHAEVRKDALAERMIPPHVAAYAAGLWTASYPPWSDEQIAGGVKTLGMGDFDPKRLLLEALYWLRGNVTDDDVVLSKALRMSIEKQERICGGGAR